VPGSEGGLFYIVNCVSSCSYLKEVGGPLEEYASQHGGVYPLELKELVPRYIGEIPKAGKELPENTRSFYERKYGLPLTIAYEASQDRKDYTMFLRTWTPGRSYYYTSREGLIN
jgi:hypothetical protein